MKEFAQTLLDTDGQTLTDFLLFLRHMGRAPTNDNLTWFLARRASEDTIANLTTTEAGRKRLKEYPN